MQRSERIPVAIYERREEGEIVEAWLVREDSDAPLCPPLSTTDREGAMRTLHRRFLDWVRWTRSERGAVVDSPMRWLPAAAIPREDLDTLFPERARWDPHTARFILPPNAPALAWPVLEEDGEIESWSGTAECFWTALPERDRPPLAHALVGRLWATLQVDRWREAGEERNRGLVNLYRHDGARWREWGTPPYLLDQPGYGWDDIFPTLVRTLAGMSDPPRALTECLDGIRGG